MAVWIAGALIIGLIDVVILLSLARMSAEAEKMEERFLQYNQELKARKGGNERDIK